MPGKGQKKAQAMPGLGFRYLELTQQGKSCLGERVLEACFAYGLLSLAIVIAYLKEIRTRRQIGRDLKSQSAVAVFTEPGNARLGIVVRTDQEHALTGVLHIVNLEALASQLVDVPGREGGIEALGIVVEEVFEQGHAQEFLRLGQLHLLGSLLDDIAHAHIDFYRVALRVKLVLLVVKGAAYGRCKRQEGRAKGDALLDEAGQLLEELGHHGGCFCVFENAALAGDLLYQTVIVIGDAVDYLRKVGFFFSHVVLS